MDARRDADRRIGAAVVDGPAERRSRIRYFIVHEPVCEDLLRAAESFERGLGLIREEYGMSIAHGFAFCALGEALLRELPDRLQHAVTELPRSSVNVDQRLTDEGIEHIE